MSSIDERIAQLELMLKTLKQDVHAKETFQQDVETKVTLDSPRADPNPAKRGDDVAWIESLYETEPFVPPHAEVKAAPDTKPLVTVKDITLNEEGDDDDNDDDQLSIQAVNECKYDEPPRVDEPLLRENAELRDRVAALECDRACLAKEHQKLMVQQKNEYEAKLALANWTHAKAERLLLEEHASTHEALEKRIREVSHMAVDSQTAAEHWRELALSYEQTLNTLSRMGVVTPSRRRWFLR